MQSTDLEAIRRRLIKRLAHKEMDAVALAALTGWDKRTVQNYVGKEGHTIPAAFIADCEAEGFASARWLLVEEGPEDPAPPDQVALRLHVIGKIADGEISPDALKILARPGSNEAVAAALRQAVGGLDATGEEGR